MMMRSLPFWFLHRKKESHTGYRVQDTLACTNPKMQVHLTLLAQLICENFHSMEHLILFGSDLTARATDYQCMLERSWELIYGMELTWGSWTGCG
jgi:hypothetical protein